MLRAEELGDPQVGAERDGAVQELRPAELLENRAAELLPSGRGGRWRPLAFVTGFVCNPKDVMLCIPVAAVQQVMEVHLNFIV